MTYIIIIWPGKAFINATIAGKADRFVVNSGQCRPDRDHWRSVHELRPSPVVGLFEVAECYANRTITDER